jgi:hypothetical protein
VRPLLGYEFCELALETLRTKPDGILAAHLSSKPSTLALKLLNGLLLN